MTDKEEFKLFMDQYVERMKADHELFMFQMKQRAIRGVIIVFAIYFSMEILAGVLLRRMK